ncbi:MAG TPA: flagellar hook-basal body complex protein [Clostridiales bacterium]|nr:flagellar hook-basal body complex protein [Clostridiales bacterium]
MMRALFSGVSGLKVHQTKMDVIGNNIANVNTVGFKSSSVNFSDIFYQTTQGASGPNPTTGTTGRNAMQIGLGASIASVTQAIATPGAAQRTDNPFDLMIEGDAFFVVNSAGTNYFTKAGSFGVDAFGTLCTPSGASVMGWQVDRNNPDNIVRDTVSKLNIMGPDNLYSQPQATKAGYVAGNIDKLDEQLTDPDGKIVNISFYDKTGQGYTADLSIKNTATDGSYTVEVTDIVNADGDSIFVAKDTDGKYKPIPNISFDFAGITYKVDDINVDEVSGEFTFTKSATDAVINFNPATGDFISVTGTEVDTANPDEDLKSIGFTVYSNNDATTDPTKNAFESIDLNFSSLTQYATSGASNITAVKGSLKGEDSGRTFGNMTGVTVDGSGKIYGKYDNGDSKLLGQIAVATFSNPSGLEAMGNNMFAATQNSGEFDGIGQDPTQGGGKLTTGVLEMSNVDLSAQFTDMITTQRGFQANSRIITTSDTLLEELINLKR